MAKSVYTRTSSKHTCAHLFIISIYKDTIQWLSIRNPKYHKIYRIFNVFHVCTSQHKYVRYLFLYIIKYIRISCRIEYHFLPSYLALLFTQSQRVTRYWMHLSGNSIDKFWHNFCTHTPTAVFFIIWFQFAFLLIRQKCNKIWPVMPRNIYFQLTWSMNVIAHLWWHITAQTK